MRHTEVATFENDQTLIAGLQDGIQFFEAGFRNKNRVVCRPVRRIEDLERQAAFEPDVAKRSKDRFQRSNAVAAVDAVVVLDFGTRRLRRIIVNVKRADFSSVKQSKGFHRTAAFVNVENVQQEIHLRMCRPCCDRQGVGQGIERFDLSPDFEQRPNAERVADLQNRTITVAENPEIVEPHVRGANGRARDAVGAELLRPIHVRLHLLDPLGPFGGVIDHPRIKGVEIFNGQTVIVDPLPGVGEFAALIDELPNLVRPRFDASIPRLGRNIDFLLEGEIETD